MGIALVITILAAVGGIDAAPLKGRRADPGPAPGWIGLGLIAERWRSVRPSASGARSVEMTGIPELIALLHSFVGLAAVLVGGTRPTRSRPIRKIHDVEVFGSSSAGDADRPIVAFLVVGADQVGAAGAAGAAPAQLGIIVASCLMTIAWFRKPHSAVAGGRRCSAR